MNNPSEETLLDEIFRDEDFSELDFSALIDPANSTINLPEIPEGEKYVVFHLDDRVYGISSKNVSEVTASLPITPLPNAPQWLSGLANLRGDIISVVDLRKLWNTNTENPLKTRLIIFNSTKNDPSVAILVDRLSEIVTLSDKDINFSAADFTDSFPSIFGKSEFKFQPLYLLDVDKIFSSLKIQEAKSSTL